MDLSIIIVSWNVKEKLKENLQALYNSQGDFQFEVLVVDNNSGDGSAAMVKTDFPQVQLMAKAENLGFAVANNQALKQARGEFILLLNPDMLLKPNTLADTLNWAKNNPQATVTGIKLLDGEGKIIKQVRRWPTLLDQLAIIWKLPHLFPAVVNKYLISDFNYETAARVDSIRGAYFLINRAAYKKISGQEQPLLDERYFVWFEEVDFCRQVYKSGGEVWYTPEASAVDYVGQSFRQLKLGQSQKYFRASMLKYFQKWGKKWEYVVLSLAWDMVEIFI